MAKYFCCRLSKNIWGNGITYDSSKTEKLVSGENQVWYSFKQNLLDHLSCNPTRSGGNFHMKAKEYEIMEEKRKKEALNTNVNIVSAGIEICKMKASGSAFEDMISFLSFCGAEVGSIGHGR